LPSAFCDNALQPESREKPGISSEFDYCSSVFADKIRQCELTHTLKRCRKRLKFQCPDGLAELLLCNVWASQKKANQQRAIDGGTDSTRRICLKTFTEATELRVFRNYRKVHVHSKAAAQGKPIERWGRKTSGLRAILQERVVYDSGVASDSKVEVLPIDRRIAQASRRCPAPALTRTHWIEAWDFK